jgi:sporulation protein YabP
MEENMEQNKKDRLISIKNCENVNLNGVSHIAGFDEKTIVLSCDFGRIIIEGDNLKIESLTKENGEISVTGKVKGVYLSEEKHVEKQLRHFFKW